MIKNLIHGFCMALADSVPGVSGGTVAFIMGFYDQFIGSIHNLAFGDKQKKIEALKYLVKLGLGWGIGMISAVLVLSSLFETKIHLVSSVFIGFIAGALPLIVMEEKACLQKISKGVLWLIIGIVLVVGITMLNGTISTSSMNLSSFSLSLSVRLFFIGMIAICAMFLPGISGSTILLIFGAYIPVITSIRQVLSFDLSPIPSLFVFGCGIIVGALSIVKVIQIALEKYRTQMVYFILGMMIGSFYAIIMGPTTLEHPQAPLSLETFSILACIIGVLLVLSMQVIKQKMENNA